MSLSNDEYKNIILSCLTVSGELSNKINSVEGWLEKLIDIRSLHKKISKELEEIIMYPNYDTYEKHGMVNGKDYIRSLCLEQIEQCKELGISVVFTKKGTIEFKKKVFAYYKLNGKDINGLIYYNKKLKIKEEEISEEGIENLEL